MTDVVLCSGFEFGERELGFLVYVPENQRLASRELGFLVYVPENQRLASRYCRTGLTEQLVGDSNIGSDVKGRRTE